MFQEIGRFTVVKFLVRVGATAASRVRPHDASTPESGQSQVRVRHR
jgi:hypothetical protein